MVKVQVSDLFQSMAGDREVDELTLTNKEVFIR